MKLKSQAHLFSLYFENLQNQISRGGIAINDTNFVNRVKNVLRLTPKDEVQLFDGKYKCIVTLNNSFKDKNTLYFDFKSEIEEIKEKSFPIHLLCCLLKKDNFESISRVIGALGITSLTPIISKKVQRVWGEVKEKDRISKIIISGCEQSKNCNIPILKNPITFQEMLKNNFDGKKVHFDLNGSKSLLNLMNDLNGNSKPVFLLFGPEGDLTQEEYESLTDFERVQLNKNVLTSVDAITISIGAIKSLK